MDTLAKQIVSSAAKRAVAQKKYQEDVYGPKRKTKQSDETRVDKRTFNKGRPKRTPAIVTPTGKDIVPTTTPAPPKKLGPIEKLAGYIIGGYLRSKLDAMDMQPAIYSDLIGKDLQDKLDKGPSINLNAVVANVKRRGRPKGAKDKFPRKRADA